MEFSSSMICNSRAGACLIPHQCFITKNSGMVQANIQCTLLPKASPQNTMMAEMMETICRSTYLNLAIAQKYKATLEPPASPP
mmetsp:Transcript_27583/g.58617  ORF Transcript_27583/g.58617 Transcript_27583/m.58617 type:complete len:83 (-) Transcript_27583:45-293(-)